MITNVAALNSASTTAQGREVRRSEYLVLSSLLSFAAILVGVLLIVGTYPRLSQTWDESAHIGTGMEWLSRGVYKLDPIDPPLPRISVAVGPYLLGSRSIGDHNPWEEGNKILSQSGHLWRTLTAARLGILPYFLIAVFLTWHITQRWLGAWPATIATFLFATCPPVLGHAAIATTDMCFVATFLWALDRIWIVLQRPSRLHFALAGIAIGFACLAKLSAVPYLCLSGGVILIYVLWRKKKFISLTGCLIAFVAAFFTLWAGYHFSIGSLATTDPASQRTVEHAASKLGPLAKPALFVANHFPAYQFPQGIRVASHLKNDQTDAYLFGQTYRNGRWYYYLVMLLVKTPLPLLLLGFTGFVAAIARLRKDDGFALIPLAGIVFPILVATMSHVNLGVRHVLVVYPFLAMLSALSCMLLWRRLERRPQIAQLIVVALLGWQLVSCLRIAPDFLTYLNEPAAPYGAFICVDSDFDWGQDLGRLTAKLNDLHAAPGWIAYNGAAQPADYGLGQWKKLNPGEVATGWIAVSETFLRKYPEQYAWLEQYQPVAEAGRTIRIYHVP